MKQARLVSIPLLRLPKFLRFGVDAPDKLQRLHEE